MGEFADDMRDRAEDAAWSRRLVRAVRHRDDWSDDDGPGLVPDDLNRMAGRGLLQYAGGGRLRSRAPWDDDDRFPSEPPLGSVLRWTVRHPNGRELSVVGLRVPPGWYLSTNYHQGPLSWERVRELIGSFPCWVAVDWVEIPQPEPEPSGDDAVASWATQFRGADPVDGTPTDRVPAGSPSYYVSTAGERAAERDAADMTVTAAERDVESGRADYPLTPLDTERADAPEPRYDAAGRDRGGWSPAELDDAEGVRAQAEDADPERDDQNRPHGEHWRV